MAYECILTEVRGDGALKTGVITLNGGDITRDEIYGALSRGIPVIAVRENKNLMRNDLSALPWAPGQYHVVDNYLEAAGLLCALRAGITPMSVRRPLALAPTVILSAAGSETDYMAEDEQEVGVAHVPELKIAVGA